MVTMRQQIAPCSFEQPHLLGLRTRIYTTRVRGSAGNSLAENAVQRIRGLACTMLEDLMSRIGVV